MWRQAGSRENGPGAPATIIGKTSGWRADGDAARTGFADGTTGRILEPGSFRGPARPRGCRDQARVAGYAGGGRAWRHGRGGADCVAWCLERAGGGYRLGAGGFRASLGDRPLPAAGGGG